ncbi:putative Gnk2-like domain-containing protein [Helianthus annuus]|nr:putative Gnk2-like domain-containing protein [Helianthus annuus]KAJ0504650.1 putative Gnk2-like domain-containing protein [Helianthus annuus]KAJ0674369.1 putative Gnk2-like domain-containing protein [Helianthus annuus]
MFQEVFCLSFFIFYLVLSLLSVCTAYSNVYLKCSQVNFTSMTPYESNVNSLFTSLVDSASIYNFNKFETSPQNDGVYGLFQCRGDLSSPNCKECVASSVGQLKTTCSLSIGGEIQLEECFVKYDDTSFFGAQDKMEVCRKCGPSIGYDSDVLNRIDGALAYLVGGNGQYFRGGDFGSIQGVAQCVQDLSLSDCQDCLAEASGRLRSECETSTWGDMYLGKCYIRYADQGKYVCGRHGNGLVNNGNSTSNSSNSRASKDDIMKWIGYIIAAVVTALGAGVGVTFACKNTNKNKNANENKNSIENRNGT